MKDIVTIINPILEIEDEVVKNISFESVDVYQFLQNEFTKGNVNENFVFQFVYRSFYRLDNAGLSTNFKEEYFKIMEEERNVNDIDPRQIVEKLYQFPTLKNKNSVQFSFTTKLMNTINCKYPIYDSEVARVFGFSSYYLNDFERKMQRYEEWYDIIQQTYIQVLSENLLESIINKFDQRFAGNTIADVKKIDFIFWSFGKIIKKD